MKSIQLFGLDTAECLGSAQQGVTVVTSELSVDTLEGYVTVSLGLLDTVAVSLAVLVVLGCVLRLSHV